MTGIEAFSLVAKLMLDSSEYERDLTDAEKEAYSKGQAIGSTLNSIGSGAGKLLSTVGSVALEITKIAGKVALAGVTATAGAVAVVTKQSVQSYAEYEQLSGGIQKLYGNMGKSLSEWAVEHKQSLEEAHAEWGKLEKAQNLMLDNANKAFMTAGMSANEYIQNVTGFSAALINSVAGDTVKAAEIADMAMQDIADNANTFGKYTAEELAGVYQALAKGQFQTLDNLNLGFGGTKEGMQALINKANELAKAQGEAGNLTMDSYADIVQAIHLVQEEMNITGTTAREAMKTLEGSANATKSAWKNVVLAIGKGEGLKEAVDGLTTAIFGTDDDTGLLNQVIPRIQTTMQGIGDFVAQAGPYIADKLPVLIDSILPPLLASAQTLVQALVDALPSILDTLIAQIPTLLNILVTTTIQLIPTLVGAFISIGSQIASALPEILKTVTDAIPELFAQIGEAISENMGEGDLLGQILTSLLNLSLAIIQAISQNLPAILEAITNAFLEIVDVITDPANLENFINTAVVLIKSLADGLIKALPKLIPAVTEVILAIATALMQPDLLFTLIEASIEIIIAIAQGLIDALPTLLQYVPKIIEAIVTGLIGAIPLLLSAVIQIITELAIMLADPNNLIDIVKCAVEIILALVKGVIEALPQIVYAVIRIIETFVKAFLTRKKQFLEVGQRFVTFVKEGLHQKIEDAKTWGRDLIQNFINGLKEKWEHLKRTVSDIAGSIKDLLGFSEPRLGPLSNFHTYAPDMMDLFMQGIRENKDKLLDTVSDAFDFENTINSGYDFDYQITANNSNIVAMLQQIMAMLPQLANNQIVLDTGVLVGQTASAYDEALGRIMSNRERNV